MADAIGQLSSRPSILDPSQICQQSNSYSSHCKNCYILLCLTAHSTGFVTGTLIKNDLANLVL
jgi:hypothetical protein